LRSLETSSSRGEARPRGQKFRNSIASYLKHEGYASHFRTTKFSAKRRHNIHSQRFEGNRDLVLKTIMERLEFLEAHRYPLNDPIRKAAKASNDRLIMTIPGADFHLTSVIFSFMDDVERFASDDQLASF